jgi:hypothetical protein
MDERTFSARGALSVRGVFDVCEPGCGENVFVRLWAGLIELIRLLVCGRFALGRRSDALLLLVLLLLGEVMGR